jgi:hypothetical protein
MANEQNDPSGNTEAFQAFVRKAATGETEAGKRSPVGITISAIAAIIIVAAVIWYVAVR